MDSLPDGWVDDSLDTEGESVGRSIGENDGAKVVGFGVGWRVGSDVGFGVEEELGKILEEGLCPGAMTPASAPPPPHKLRGGSVDPKSSLHTVSTIQL